MNRYDRDMMHDRELIYDAKRQEKHGGNKKHDEELIYDTKGEIHRIDEQKHSVRGAHKVLKHSHRF